MWELDCEESWAPKNWCFWTVVLEKTLVSSLDCTEIKPVHSKGDQSWVFFGRTDAKLKLQYFGHLMRRVQILQLTNVLIVIGSTKILKRNISCFKPSIEENDPLATRYVHVRISYSLLFSCSVVSNSLWSIDCSTPGFSILHHLPELSQTHVHWFGDAIQSAHPLSSPSPPAFNHS